MEIKMKTLEKRAVGGRIYEDFNKGKIWIAGIN